MGRWGLTVLLAGSLIHSTSAAVDAYEPFCGPGSQPTDALRDIERRIAALPEEDTARFQEASQRSAEAMTSLQLHDWASAEARFTDAMQILQRQKLDRSPAAVVICNGLAALHQNQGDHALAETFHRRALSLAQAYCRPEDDLIITLQANIASSLDQQARYEAARDLLLAALQGFSAGERRLPEWLRVQREGQLRYLLGQAYLHLAEYDAARAVLLEILGISKPPNELLPQHLADTLQLLGRVEAAAGRPEAAARYFDQAIELYRAYFPDGPSLEETIGLRDRLR